MPKGAKIATCCYCGTRAALVLKGESRHELACSSCGAPLHDMKNLKADHGGKHSAPISPMAAHPQKTRPMKKKKKPKKSFAQRFFDEAFDAIEDIFD